METIELTYPHQLNKEELEKTVAAIGFFDGVHKGHQTVIQHAIDQAKEKDMKCAVITFYPHPSVVLRNNEGVKYITPRKEKEKVLEQLGVDRMYIINFNRELSSLQNEEFLSHFIIGLNIQHLVAGFDFTYGHRGMGNMETIGDDSKGRFTYSIIEKVTMDGEKISSTRIRTLLDAGKLEEVNKLLGRTFSTSGEVIKGDQRGRKLGFPTANVAYTPEAHLPKPGIYAVQVLVDGKYYGGLASLGINPTFTAERNNLSLEVNILDFDQDIYGKEIIIEWYKFIRDEERFDNVEALITQMHKDETEIRTYLNTI